MGTIIRKVFTYFILPICIAGLVYLNVQSISEPVKFKKHREYRESVAIQRLKDIRDLQVAYKNVNGKYTADIDSLITFYKEGKMKVVMQIGSQDDSVAVRIAERLQPLVDVGLSYIKLGQSSSTLSGGESQRVKLATELAKKDTGKTIYILDEPTTGLHFEDIRVLMNVLNRLVDKGNTVIVIEHNLDVIKLADYIIDMGPEGGRGGGQVLSTGTPEEVAESKLGYTPPFIKDELK